MPPEPTRLAQPGLAYALYRRALRAYRKAERAGRGRVYRRALEAVLETGARVLGGSRDLRFPARAMGGFWWTSRWRFETLAGWFEYESVMLCRDRIRPGMTVVDAGAHIGYYARLFSRWVGPAGRVLAFEPHPENLALLCANLAAPRYRNVEALGLALAEHAGRRALYVSPGSSNHSLIAGYTVPVAVLEVECVALDEFLRQRGIGRVDFVKMDLEGAEMAALEGMRGTLQRSPHAGLLIECNPAALRAGGRTPEDLGRALERIGVAREVVIACGPVDELDDRPEQLPVNWLCRKRAS